MDERVVCATSESAKNIMKTISAMRQDHALEEMHRCAAHTIHLCVTKSLELGEISGLLKLVRATVASFRRSHNLKEALRKAQVTDAEDLIEDSDAPEKENSEYRIRPLKLVIDVVTRWSSTFYMVNRFLKPKEPITAITSDLQMPTLSNMQWKDLKGLSELLKPFRDAVSLLEGEQYVTLSLFFLVLHCWFLF